MPAKPLEKTEGAIKNELATLDTQDTIRRRTKRKTKKMSNTDLTKSRR